MEAFLGGRGAHSLCSLLSFSSVAQSLKYGYQHVRFVKVYLVITVCVDLRVFSTTEENVESGRTQLVFSLILYTRSSYSREA